MKIAVNADPAHRPSIPALVDSGLYGVRFPVRYGRPYTRFVRSLLANAMDVLPIVTNEFFTRREQQEQDWEAGFRRFTRQYPWLLIAQVGNEMDQVSESSEDRPPEEYSALLAASRNALGPDFTIVVGGAVSGDASYFDAVDLSPADVMAVHPYAKDAWNVGPLLQSYQRFGLPLWVTEFGCPTQDFPDEHERAVFYSDFLVALAEENVERAYPYCWSDRQAPEGFGLLDRRNQPKETAAAVFDAVGAV